MLPGKNTLERIRDDGRRILWTVPRACHHNAIHDCAAATDASTSTVSLNRAPNIIRPDQLVRRDIRPSMEATPQLSRRCNTTPSTKDEHSLVPLQQDGKPTRVLLSSVSTINSGQPRWLNNARGGVRSFFAERVRFSTPCVVMGWCGIGCRLDLAIRVGGSTVKVRDE